MIHFKEINNLITNINLFSVCNKISPKRKKDQLFSKDPPPIELISDIFSKLLNKDINDNIYYEFSKKNIKDKNIAFALNEFIPELKKYYLKCKHKKYLENLNEKKIITLFRQILRPHNISLIAVEKYNNGEKYLLYIIKRKKIGILKKIDSTINFD